MDNLHITFAGLTLLFAALAAIALWSRRKSLFKMVALGLVIIALPLGAFAYVDLLAKPKPLHLEHRDLGEIEIISAYLKEGEAIYLWVNVADAPRFYEMPWNEAIALELQTVMRDARTKGVGVGMRLQELVEGAFENTEELRPAQKFYALPYPAPPEKVRVIESPKWEM
jgi:hypothetical protein